MSKTTTKERDEARAALREMLPPGSTVHTILRHVSRSGMLRHIDPVIIVDGEPQSIAWRVAPALGEKCAKDGGVKVGGCGMDMGFHLVYTLSHTLYPDGFTCIGRKRRCPSNDHFNGDRNYRRHKHTSGGYALLQRWL